MRTTRGADTVTEVGVRAQAHQNYRDGDRFYHYHASQISHAKHVSKT